MKFLAKLAVVVLILGGILFAAGHAMGGVVASALYGGVVAPIHEALSIGWGGWFDVRRGWDHMVGCAIDEVQDTTRDALDDVQDALGHHPDDHHD